MAESALGVDRAGDRRDPDLIVADFSGNDAFEAQDWGGVSTRGSGNGRASVPRSGFDAVFAATEALVRFALTRYPDAALVVVESYCSDARAGVVHASGHPNGKHATAPARAAHRAATRLYGVPYVEFEALLAVPCGDLWLPDVGQLHPTWVAHAALADALALWWDAWTRSPPTPPPDAGEVAFDAGGGKTLRLAAPRTPADPPAAAPKLAAAFSVCERALSTYDARRGGDVGAAAPRAVAGDWALTEDRPGKPGWIATAPASALEFDLAFGPSPRATLVYVKSFEGFGRAALEMSGSGNEVHLDAYDAAPATTSEVVVLNVQQTNVGSDPLGVKGFGVPAFGNATLRVTFAGTCRVKASDPPCKFKVIAVTSC